MNARNLSLTVLLAFAFMIIGGALIQMPVMEGKYLNWLRPLYILFYPPEDLYEPLVKIELDALGTEKLIHYNIIHRYVGSYSIGLYVDNDVDVNNQKLNLGSQFEWNCSSDAGQVIAEKLGTNASPFIGLRGNGYRLALYGVPNDLPQGESVACELKVLGGEVEGGIDLKGSKFYASKFSDL